MLLSCFRSCRGTWVGSRNLRRCCNGGVVSAGDRDVTVFGRVEGSRRRDEPHTGSSKIIARHGAAARAALGVLAIGRPRRRAPLAQERPMSLHFSHFARPLLPGSAAASSTGASMAVLPGSPPSPAPPAQANLLPRFGLNLENHSCSPPVDWAANDPAKAAPSADHTPERERGEWVASWLKRRTSPSRPLSSTEPTAEGGQDMPPDHLLEAADDVRMEAEDADGDTDDHSDGRVVVPPPAPPVQ